MRVSIVLRAQIDVSSAVAGRGRRGHRGRGVLEVGGDERG